MSETTSESRYGALVPTPSLDRETLVTDLTLVRAIIQGKYTYLKEDGKIVICMRSPCNNCATCPSFGDTEKE